MPTGLLMFCFLGKVNFTVTAEAVEREDVCMERTAVVPESGGKDTVVKHLLVKVRLHCRVLVGLELKTVWWVAVGRNSQLRTPWAHFSGKPVKEPF